MKLDEFLKQNSLTLPPEVYSLCLEGLERMEKSVDVLHDHTHTERLFESLNQFMHHEKSINWNQVNMPALVLAICWHDVWKSSRFPTRFHTFMIDQYWDGVGSMQLFAHAAKNISVSKHVYQNARYSIRVHGKFRRWPLRSTESRILKDIDRLDQWSAARLERLKSKYLSTVDSLQPRHLAIAKFYFRFFLVRQHGNHYFYPWAKQEFAKRKADHLEEIGRLIEEYDIKQA